MCRRVCPSQGLLAIGIIVILGGVGCSGSLTQSGGADTFEFALVIALITFLAALGGGSLPLVAKMNHEHRLLGALTSVSAGFLIAAACLIVIPEGFERYSMASEAASTHVHEAEHGEDGHHHHHSSFIEPSLVAGLAVLLGFLMMLLTESFGFGHDIHEEHHHHAGGHVHHPTSETHGKQLAAVVVIGLTVHTVADGMAIGAGLATGSHALTGSLVATLLTHKVPAAFSLTMFSQHAHGSRRRTWLDLLVFSVATPMAILVTWAVLGALSDQIVGLVLLFSAGTFIYVATIDVLPNVLHSSRRRLAAFQVIVGCLSLLAVILILDALGFSLHDHG